MQRRTIIILAAVFVVVGLFLAGIGWIAWSVIDQLGAPGVPGATGSGACVSADSVNLQLTFADGHTIHVCTRDRPACPNEAIGGILNRQKQPTVSEFTLRNQLRSSSGRYILFVRLDSPLAAEASEQTLTLGPGQWSKPGEPLAAPQMSATVSVSPIDQMGGQSITQSGALTVSSTHGVAHGRIDGKFISGEPTRADRPAPSSTTASPGSISGTFACNR